MRKLRLRQSPLFRRNKEIESRFVRLRSVLCASQHVPLLLNQNSASAKFLDNQHAEKPAFRSTSGFVIRCTGSAPRRSSSREAWMDSTLITQHREATASVRQRALDPRSRSDTCDLNSGLTQLTRAVSCAFVAKKR